MECHNNQGIQSLIPLPPRLGVPARKDNNDDHLKIARDHERSKKTRCQYATKREKNQEKYQSGYYRFK